MPGITPRRALVLVPVLVPWFAAADFPSAGEFFRQGRQYFDIYSARSKPSPHDETQPLEARARAYLDGHCSVCHQPGGVLKGSLDLRFATPLAQTGLLALSGRTGPEGFLPRLRPGKPGESDLYRRLSSMGSDAMPPLGRTSLDERGLALIRAWIEGLSVLPPSPSSLPSPAAESWNPARAVFHDPERAPVRLFIPRADAEPSTPLSVRICDAGGKCRFLVPDTVPIDAARDGWVVRPAGPLPRGRYALILAWQGRTGRRILLVL